MTLPQTPKQPRYIPNLPQPSESQNLPKAEVQNLCWSLDQARQASKILKLYLSQRGVLSSSHISRSHSRVVESDHCTQEIFTLEQVLHKPSKEPFSNMWNPTQRMILSLNLASSLLQLCSTPWMAEPLSKQNICFWSLRSPQNAHKAAFLVDTSHPFIVHKFKETSGTRPIRNIDARNQLLNLGILLLEIGHEKLFESWTSAHGFILTQTYGSRYDAASAWLHDSAGKLLSSYYDAAARCIECTFQTRSPIPGWEDLDFRKSVCELVIKPLWNNCFTMDGQ